MVDNCSKRGRLNLYAIFLVIMDVIMDAQRHQDGTLYSNLYMQLTRMKLIDNIP